MMPLSVFSKVECVISKLPLKDLCRENVKYMRYKVAIFILKFYINPSYKLWFLILKLQQVTKL